MTLTTITETGSSEKIVYAAAAFILVIAINENVEEHIIKFKTLLDKVHNHELLLPGYESWYNYSLTYFNHPGQFLKATEVTEMKKKTLSTHCWLYIFYLPLRSMQRRHPTHRPMGRRCWEGSIGVPIVKTN